MADDLGQIMIISTVRIYSMECLVPVNWRVEVPPTIGDEQFCGRLVCMYQCGLVAANTVAPSTSQHTFVYKVLCLSIHFAAHMYGTSKTGLFTLMACMILFYRTLL